MMGEYEALRISGNLINVGTEFSAHSGQPRPHQRNLFNFLCSRWGIFPVSGNVY